LSGLIISICWYSENIELETCLTYGFLDLKYLSILFNRSIFSEKFFASIGLTSVYKYLLVFFGPEFIFPE